MKRKVVAGLLAAFLPLGAAGAASPDVSMVPAGEQVAADGDLTNKTEVHLVQQAQKVMRRDRVRVELRAEAKGSSAGAVQNEVNGRMTTALRMAKGYSAVIVQTGSYSVYRRSEARSSDTWYASQTVSLTSGDFEAALGLAGELQSSGLVMAGMRFSVAPDSLKAAQRELTTEALTALRQRASEVAGDLGMQVDRYRQVDVGNAQESSDGPSRPFAAAQSAAGAASPPVAEAGEVTVILSVQADIVLATR